MSDVTPIAITQAQREHLIDQLLDTSADQWFAWAQTTMAANDVNMPEEVGPKVAEILVSFNAILVDHTAADEAAASVRFLQAVSTLSDGALAWLLAAIHGKDPLEP